MCLLKEVSDTTHTSWERVYKMNTIEFFNIVSFATRYNKEMGYRAGL